jgi:D-sedoheptulose 7-phosphate isomerase
VNGEPGAARTSDGRQVYTAALAAAVAAHERARMQDPGPLLDAALAMVEAFRRGNRVLLFGNGGSAADAQHVAAELVGRFVRERPPVPALALSVDTSVLTAIGNDYGFERVFARQIEAHGRSGDVAVAISTSGASANVLAAVVAAAAAGLKTIAFTGRDGGALGRAVDIHVNVPEQETARIQEVQRTLLHVLCDLVERELV